MHKAALV